MIRAVALLAALFLALAAPAPPARAAEIDWDEVARLEEEGAREFNVAEH